MPIQVVSVKDVFGAGASTRTIKALVAGPPGSGKTRTASTWPNPLYIDIEGLLLSVRDRDVHRIKIDQVSEMEEVKALLDQAPDIRRRMLGIDVRTVIIDTVDELAKMLRRERIKAEKIDDFRVSDWGWYGEQLRSLLRGFRNLSDLNVIFNVHIKDQQDNETGRLWIKPDIPGSVGNEIAAYVNEAFLLVSRSVRNPTTGDVEIKRYLQTYPDAQHDWVKDHSGTLPMEFPINFEDDYERLSEFIFGNAPAAPVAQLTLSTSASIAEEDEAAVPEAPQVAPRPVKAPAKKKAAVKRAVDLPDRGEVPVAEEPAEPEAPVEKPPVEAEPVGVPEKETESSVSPDDGDPAQPRCSECGVGIDNPDVAEVSEIRYGVPLCREHFAARRRTR